jgi:hypothetical protein
MAQERSYSRSRTMTNMAKGSEAIIRQKGMHNLAEQIQKGGQLCEDYSRW